MILIQRLLLILCFLASLILPLNAANEIDKCVESSLKQSGVTPSEICSDEVFLRRVYIAATGKLPTLDESRSFLESTQSDKRERLIDQLLDSSAYVDYLTLRWGDLLKIKSEFPSNIWPNGVQAYNRWVREHISANTPYNEFVRQLLISTGSDFRSPEVNFYRAFVERTPEVIAANVELLFLGRRSATKAYRAFFSQVKYKKTGEWKEEIVYVELDNRAPKSEVTMPGGDVIKLRTGEDFRDPFVEWLTSPDNEQFSRVMANRVWYWLMGRGVVHEADDFRADNKPSNPQLLTHLSTQFRESGYDVKGLFREILNSDTFQRSSLPNETNGEDKTLFSHYPTIRLSAETIIDGISDITGVNDRYVSRVPEPYSYYPADMRSYQIGDATVSSPQLDLFGRPSRDMSYESSRSYVLNSRQTLYLLNSTTILDKITSSSKITALISEGESNAEVVESLYLLTLSRYPSEQERQIATQYIKKIGNKRRAMQDLVWALINTPEFMFNH